MLKELKRSMEQTGDAKRERQMYERICSIVENLSDRNAFRARLEALKRPDGSIQFSFTPAAWKTFQKRTAPTSR